MSKLNYTCGQCGKNYIRKCAYDHHVLLCKFAFANVQEKSQVAHKLSEEEQEMINVPNNKELYLILMNLHSKYEKLERDYGELKKFVEVKKKKVDMIEYLNTNFVGMQYDFTDFIGELNLGIGVEELELVFKKDYVEGLFEIIMNFIERFRMGVGDGGGGGGDGGVGGCFPVKAFSHKDGVLYIYFKNDGIWRVLSERELNAIIAGIDKKILMLFLEWKKDAQAKMDDDRFAEMYIRNMKRVIGGNFESGGRNRKIMIKNKLYKYLRVNLKNVVSYDYE